MLFVNDAQKNTLSQMLLVQVEPPSKMSIIKAEMGKNNENRRQMKKRRRREGQELALGSQFSTEVLDNINTEEKRQVNGKEKAKIK